MWQRVCYFVTRFSIRLKHSGRLRTMKLESNNFLKLFTPELKQLISLFENRRYELRIAGGAVRDLLMGVLPSDIDFATVATPCQMKEMFDAEGIRMINNRGESHGTITARINDQNFEVTTLRIDKLTDGRHAQVEFTQDWQLDANRRDLTINAMFLGFDGTLYDYFNGVSDLDQRLVRFVGEASERIQEDYLRIMRYFRFYGRISPHSNKHEPETLQAIRENAHGLSGISGERLWTELGKIVCGQHSDSIIECMSQLGLLQYLGLPDVVDIAEYREVYKRSSGLGPLPSTLLTATLKSDNDIERLNKRLKMSNDHLGVCSFIIAHRDDPIGSEAMRYFQDIYTDTKETSRLTMFFRELLKYRGEHRALDELKDFVPRKFTVTGFDLFNANVPKGPVFGRTLAELRNMWKLSGYTLTKEQLIEKIPEALQKCL